MNPQPKLLDQLRNAIRLKHYPLNTERAYVGWARRYILFHNKKHPMDMDTRHIQVFLTDLAVNKHVAASTQNQALNALVFLYKHVLHIDPGDFSSTVRAKKPQKLPVVLTQGEMNLILKCLPKTTHGLIIHMLYGTGMRLKETLRLRVQDLDFIKGTTTVRNAKGAKDRVTMLPDSVQPALKKHLNFVQAQFRQDMTDGFADVYLPYALARKYPKAGKQWRWQYVFPAEYPSDDPRSGVRRRHHIYDRSVGKTITKVANLAGIQKNVTAHVFRHSFATHLLEAGTSIRVVQELLGHKSIETTKIYLHCLNTPGETVKSPLDRL